MVPDSSPGFIVQDLQDRKQITGCFSQSPQVMNLPFVDRIRRADRDNAIDLYIGEDYMDVLADGAWPEYFQRKAGSIYKRGKESMAGQTDRCHSWI